MMMMRRAVLLLMTSMTLSCGGEAGVGADRTDVGGGSALFFNPAVASDGRLAYAKLIDGKGAIFVADQDGRDPRRVSFGTWDYSPMWSPDARWIAIGRDMNGGDVLIVPSDSGAERMVASTGSPEGALEWMPDGSGLLFARSTPAGDETWIYDVATGKTEQFLKLSGSAIGFPAPDGNLIGYVRIEGEKSTIWLWDRATDAHRPLTTEGFEVLGQQPFSPDGRSLLFISNRSGTGDVWQADVASGALTQLTRDVAGDSRPRWSPDGTQILFESDRGGQPDVWTLRSGEEDVRRVTDDALDETDPVWSADGRGIVFMAAAGFYHVYLLPLDGSPAQPRTSGDFDVSDISVSPDGELIAYAGSRNGDQDVWVVPAAGGEPRLVSAAPGPDNSVRFSPDGSEIAFVSQRGGTSDIWIVPTAGGTARRLTEWTSSDIDPRWSADGRTIFFRSNRNSRGFDLWAVAAAGGEPVRRTNVGTVLWARLSPDGQTFALGAGTAASGGLAVFTQPVEGGALRLLAPAQALFAQWSRDSREVAVLRSADGYGTVEVYGMSGTLLRKLSPEEKVYEWPAGWTSDGSRVILSYQDIYADGADRMAILPSAGGARTPLGLQALTVRDWSLARDTDALAVVAAPAGRTLTRVRVP